jgi:Flp pilus assembly protein TadG
MRRIERARRALLRTFVESRPAQPEADDRHKPTRRRIGARRRREGQSLVEFAVVLPIFLLLLAGLVDFGLGLYAQMTIINASREGARLGIVELGVPGADINAAKQNVKDRVSEMANGLDVDTTVTCTPSCVSGNPVVVQVDYPYRLIWPLAFGNSLNLSSTVQMRIE